MQAAGKSTAMHSKHKGKSGFQPRAQGGGAAPPRSPAPESSRGFPSLPPQRSEPRPFVEENHKNPVSTKAVRQEGSGGEAWAEHRARGLDGAPPDMDPKMPRQRMTEWNRPKSQNVTVIAEETLTIKVDMNQPVNKNR